MRLTPGLRRIWVWLYDHRWTLMGLFAGVLLPLFIFGALAENLVEHEKFFFDEPILLFLRRHSTPALDRIFISLSLLGYRFGVVPVDLAVLILLLWRRRWGDASFWILATGGAALLNVAAKPAFSRLRPDLWLSLAPETTFSFPSGHAMGSMALVTALVVLTWPTAWRWPTLFLGSLFVLGVGLSRVYLGVHYPSDILAGWVASLSWVLGVSLILYRHIAKPAPQTEPA